MNERQQNLRIGLFTISSLILLTAVLFALGLSDLFASKVTLYTFFSESVQGLTVGSAVKYRGVPVGSVSRLSIDMNSKKVFVIMEIEPHYFSSIPKNTKSSKNTDIKNEFHSMLNNEIKQGLRCRLEFAGITGMKFIDFDYFGSTEINDAPERQHPQNAPDAFYIPSVPSTIKDLSGTLSSYLERLSHIRFEDIASELERSLSRLSEILSDPAIRSTISRINDAAENLEISTNTVAKVLDEKRLTRLLNSIEKDLEILQHLGEQLSISTEKMNLPASTAAFRRAINHLLESKEDLSGTLSKFNQTLESIRMLTDYLTNDPSSIIRGKQKKSTDE